MDRLITFQQPKSLIKAGLRTAYPVYTCQDKDPNWVCYQANATVYDATFQTIQNSMYNSFWVPSSLVAGYVFAVKENDISGGILKGALRPNCPWVDGLLPASDKDKAAGIGKPVFIQPGRTLGGIYAYLKCMSVSKQLDEMWKC